MVQAINEDGSYLVRVAGRTMRATPRSDEVLAPGMLVTVAPDERGGLVILGAVRG